MSRKRIVWWFPKYCWIVWQLSPIFLPKVIMRDEIWFLNTILKRKDRAGHTSPRLKKTHLSKSMLIVFFDSQKVVYKEFVSPEQTVNQTFYVQVLERLRRILRVCPDIATTWILHHDNVPSYTSLAVKKFLAQKNIFPHPPYSSDLAPCDFFLFPKIKTYLKGHHFGTVQNVQSTATKALNSLSHEDFLHCNEEWQLRSESLCSVPRDLPWR